MEFFFAIGLILVLLVIPALVRRAIRKRKERLAASRVNSEIAFGKIRKR